MLYLEDYLEMIEHLPAELRDRFTEMREMDLSVQNQVDSLEEKQRTFFGSCKKMKPQEREEDYEKIRKEYAKILEDTSEKIQIAEESYSLVDKYLRKLDQELHNFKMELEADNRGITEELEKRSLELDYPPSSSMKENRHPKKHARKHLGAFGGESGLHNRLDRSSNKISDNVSLDSMSTGSSSSAKLGNSSSLTAPVLPAVLAPGQSMYPLQHMGAGSNPIAAAASQAIAATQQLTGRRTSSLKASYEAINLGVQAAEFSIGQELASVGVTGSTPTAGSLTPAASETGASGGAKAASGCSSSGGAAASTTSALASGSTVQGPTKKKRSHSRSMSASLVAQQLLDVIGGNESLLSDDLLGSTNESTASDQDWFDPSEPRYCICNQVSYGDMVACDNQDCPYEWFHYPCVGITAPPKGKWFCPSCNASMARRKGRK